MDECSLSRGIRDFVMRALLQWLVGPIQDVVESILIAVIGRVLKSAVKVMFGASMAIFGIALLAVGVVYYLTELLRNPWIAWLLVGSVLLLVGTAVLLSSMPRRSDH